MKRAAPLLVASFALPALAAAEDPSTLLPDVTVRLEAAHYAPAEPDFQWDGWIGAGAGLLRVRQSTVYFTADVETVIGNVKRAFDANQANYHLEAGVRTRLGPHEATLFFHHVSRHDVDRPKDQAVDWNVLGVRAAFRLPERLPIPVRVAVGAGHTTVTSLVGYGWELTGRIEADLVTRHNGQAYASADARAVTTESSPEFPRRGFLDARVEAGARFPRGGRTLDLFVAYEHRNDVLLEAPGFRDRAIVGFRIGYATSAGPSAR